MTKQNEKRNEIQDKAVELSKIHRCLILEHSTGTGKTLASIKIVEDFVKSKRDAVIYLICKESNHIDNWEQDIKKHKKSQLFTDAKRFLYASLHKHTKVADIVLLDECHALTDKRVLELKRLIGPNTKLIFLSATIPNEKKILIQQVAKCTPHYYSISLVDAINMGLLPEPKVIVHKTTLANDGNRIYKWNMQKGSKVRRPNVLCNFNQMWPLFNASKSINLDVLCNEQEYYKLISDKMEFHYNKSIELGQPFNEKIKHKNLYLNLGSQRKRFIAQVKTTKSKEIIEQFRANKKRFITFTGSIEQSLYLGGNSSVNSKNHKDVNKDLIDGFNSKMYSELFAVGMLREGMNLTDIEKGLIVQLDSTIGSFFQMMGRMLRHQFPEIHMIKLEGTQDEKYFEKAMADFDEKYVTYV